MPEPGINRSRDLTTFHNSQALPLEKQAAACLIEIKGTVQGVGFRPFVYRTAQKYRVYGEVCNDGQGVKIKALAEKTALNAFIREIQITPPPLAVIRHLTVKEITPFPCTAFRIIESEAGHFQEIDITPDIGTCAACLAELHEPANRRYRYPFINCTDCGPRYTIIEALPYDRPLTTMKSFSLCPSCAIEYSDPADRRFHAQPVACPVCGPHLQLLDRCGEPVKTADPLQAACELLTDGKIIAIKGLGGFHLVCRADREETVATLRRRKQRDEKPFALMVPDIGATRELACVSAEEERLLTGFQKPIVLLDKLTAADRPVAEKDTGSGKSLLCPSVAPGLTTYGIMLPYTPLHQLLFTVGGFKALIMTSANTTDEPMVYKNEQALQELKGIADYFLLHNRDIQIRVDDSIVRIIAGKPVFLRRARGYVPEPLPSPFTVDGIIACGGILKSTVTIGRGSHCYVSAYLGKMENLETLQSLEETTAHLLKLLRVRPAMYACDLHPESLSSRFAVQAARTGGVPLEHIQHHHAHAAACMAENGLSRDEEALCVTYDGTGYGEDGTIWGGEILLAGYRHFKRLAHLVPVPMPGGELAIKYPWRMAWGALYARLQEKMYTCFPALPEQDMQAVASLLETDTSCPLTSSMGRLFDALAALAGLCTERHYEGQPAVLLEGLTDTVERDAYAWRIEQDAQGKLLLDGPALLEAALQDLCQGATIGVVSARFHNSIAGATAALVGQLARTVGVKKVCLSGGCFQNALLSARTVTLLGDAGLQVFTHRLVSPNDEGISYGQAVIAGARKNS